MLDGALTMSIRSETLLVVRQRPRRPLTFAGWLDREGVFSWLMMAAPLAFLAAFIGYPFLYGIVLSLQNRPVAHAGTFVGLQNFVTNFHDPIFWRVASTPSSIPASRRSSKSSPGCVWRWR